MKDKYGVNVHTSYIAQVKRMCGLDIGENYNKSKKENPEVKRCPQEKVEYIKDALRYFSIIEREVKDMNIFSVGDGEEYDLTRENYIAKTHKRFPFYQNPKRYQNPYFAICPACNNPIQIINLFGKQYEEEQTRNTTMHGRHFIRSVDGLPLYNRENYDACPIHNPIAFSCLLYTSPSPRD